MKKSQKSKGNDYGTISIKKISIDIDEIEALEKFHAQKKKE